MQNWIGGSDDSPRGALHVPPAPARVDELMDAFYDYPVMSVHEIDQIA